jgi:hypothetical protein
MSFSMSSKRMKKQSDEVTNLLTADSKLARYGSTVRVVMG